MTSKDISKTEIQEIQFGNGGGFTGEIITYTLNGNGLLNKADSEIKKLKNKKTFEYFKEAQNLKDYKFNEPENVYSFLEIKTKNKTNRIVWYLGSNNIDNKVIELYNNLLSETK
jgi:hypothetical protein